MPRKPRIHLPGGFYHVMLRGNGGQDIFFTNEDREKFYDLLEEGTKRYDYFVHAFCLMLNHVHLLLQQGSYPLSKPLQNVSFRYTRWINKCQKRTGHLFQG
jgi:putative transposase